MKMRMSHEPHLGNIEYDPMRFEEKIIALLERGDDKVQALINDLIRIFRDKHDYEMTFFSNLDIYLPARFPCDKIVDLLNTQIAFMFNKRRVGEEFRCLGCYNILLSKDEEGEYMGFTRSSFTLDKQGRIHKLYPINLEATTPYGHKDTYIALALMAALANESNHNLRMMHEAYSFLLINEVLIHPEHDLDCVPLYEIWSDSVFTLEDNLEQEIGYKNIDIAETELDKPVLSLDFEYIVQLILKLEQGHIGAEEAKRIVESLAVSRSNIATGVLYNRLMDKKLTAPQDLLWMTSYINSARRAAVIFDSTSSSRLEPTVLTAPLEAYYRRLEHLSYPHT